MNASEAAKLAATELEHINHLNRNPDFQWLLKQQQIVIEKKKQVLWTCSEEDMPKIRLEAKAMEEISGTLAEIETKHRKTLKEADRDKKPESF